MSGVQINWSVVPTVVTHLIFLLPLYYVIRKVQILFLDLPLLSAALLQSMLYHTTQMVVFGSNFFLTSQVADLTTAQFMFVLVAVNFWKYPSYGIRASLLAFLFLVQANLYLYFASIAMYITLPLAFVGGALGVIVHWRDLQLVYVAAGLLSGMVSLFFIEQYNPTEYGAFHGAWHFFSVLSLYLFYLSTEPRHLRDLDVELVHERG
jgi:hypothetical protein